jgi:3-oxoacyl-[acyl-carrier protein] reductase
MTVNVTGPFLMMKAVIGDMIARKYGRIINIASVAGKEGNPNMVCFRSLHTSLFIARSHHLLFDSLFSL